MPGADDPDARLAFGYAMNGMGPRRASPTARRGGVRQSREPAGIHAQPQRRSRVAASRAAAATTVAGMVHRAEATRAPLTGRPRVSLRLQPTSCGSAGERSGGRAARSPENAEKNPSSGLVPRTVFVVCSPGGSRGIRGIGRPVRAARTAATARHAGCDRAMRLAALCAAAGGTHAAGAGGCRRSRRSRTLRRGGMRYGRSRGALPLDPRADRCRARASKALATARFLSPARLRRGTTRHERTKSRRGCARHSRSRRAARDPPGVPRRRDPVDPSPTADERRDGRDRSGLAADGADGHHAGTGRSRQDGPSRRCRSGQGEGSRCVRTRRIAGIVTGRIIRRVAGSIAGSRCTAMCGRRTRRRRPDRPLEHRHDARRPETLAFARRARFAAERLRRSSVASR